jgi:antitoxin MazE
VNLIGQEWPTSCGNIVITRRFLPVLTTIRRMGNSQGVLIPKPVLQQVGFAEEVEMLVVGNTLVLQRPALAPREGWAEASKELATSGDDALVWPEFANEDDAELTW